MAATQTEPCAPRPAVHPQQEPSASKPGRRSTYRSAEYRQPSSETASPPSDAVSPPRLRYVKRASPIHKTSMDQRHFPQASPSPRHPTATYAPDMRSE